MITAEQLITYLEANTDDMAIALDKPVAEAEQAVNDLRHILDAVTAMLEASK